MRSNNKWTDLLSLHDNLLVWSQFAASLVLNLGDPSMNRRVSLTRNVQKDGLHGMDHGLSALPEWEQSNGNGAAEKPDDANDDPA